MVAIEFTRKSNVIMKTAKLFRRIVLVLVAAVVLVYLLADKAYEAVSFMYADF